MATIPHQGSWLAKGVHQVVWTGLANGDFGDGMNDPQLPYKTFEVEGVFGVAGSVSLEGSNTGVVGTWFQLRDWQGTAIAFTAGRCWTPVDNPRFIRPHVTAGDGTTLVNITAICVS